MLAIIFAMLACSSTALHVRRSLPRLRTAAFSEPSGAADAPFDGLSCTAFKLQPAFRTEIHSSDDDIGKHGIGPLAQRRSRREASETGRLTRTL